MLRFTIPPLALGIALLVLVETPRAAFSADDMEPVYGGERLSGWMDGLNSDDFDDRRATETALRKVDLKELPSLVGALKSKNVDFRRDAATILGAIGPKARNVLKALIPLLKDENAEVRLAAAVALGGSARSLNGSAPTLTKTPKQSEARRPR
jgi:HEAT repeat protein